ncbi:MAG: hypothetical protein MR965_10825 [Lachnospiraceae bacterium]|nr:hypothetical protein [Lachnospiraceae bacterium]
MQKRVNYPKGNAMVFPLELAQIPKEEETVDLKYLYPLETAELNQLVMNVCDQLEYDGSPMYDRYPDKVTTERMAAGICCHYCKDKDKIDQGWLKPMVEIMLCHEMNCRREKRCRHKQRLRS